MSSTNTPPTPPADGPTAPGLGEQAGMIRAALFRVAENVAKHTIQRDGWSPDDACFLVDLRESESELLVVIDNCCNNLKVRLGAAEVALAASREEAARLREAVAEHHRQKADDRCIEDDDRLYAAAGLPPCDRRVGDKAAMLRNCERFIDRRCEGGGWPSYAELEADRDRLRERVAELEAGELDTKHKAVKASSELAEVAWLRKQLDLIAYNAAGHRRLADHMTAECDRLRAEVGRLKESVEWFLRVVTGDPDSEIEWDTLKNWLADFARQAANWRDEAVELRDAKSEAMLAEEECKLLRKEIERVTGIAGAAIGEMKSGPYRDQLTALLPAS